MKHKYMIGKKKNYREFQPMTSAPDDILYHQIKTAINFQCRRGLNPKSLIQPSKTLPVEQTETHVIENILGYEAFEIEVIR